MEHERVLFRGEIERPNDVDYGEDEPACCYSVDRRCMREDGLIDSDDREYDGDGEEGRKLETVHCYRVGGEGVYNAKDEEELEKDGEPQSANGFMSDCFAAPDMR